MEAFCAYQERCDYEVRKKLNSWFMDQEHIAIIIADLITNNFLNEQRFAEAFVSGKFRIKNWGRIKIKRELKQRKISAYSINKGMEQIDEQEYLSTLQRLAENKKVKGTNKWDKMAKIKRYLSSKGYESDLIHEVVNELMK